MMCDTIIMRKYRKEICSWLDQVEIPYQIGDGRFKHIQITFYGKEDRLSFYLKFPERVNEGMVGCSI